MKHMIGIAFRQWRNWSPLYDMCWSRFTLLKNGNSMIWSIGVAFHQWKNWSPLYDMCWSRLSFLNRRNPMIWSTWSALPFINERTDHHFTICADQDFRFSKTETRWFEAHDRRCLSPMKELITTLRLVPIKIFRSQRRKLNDLKHTIGIAFRQWKNWSPLYDLCWSRFFFLKDGNLMIWSTWSALPFTSERTDHHFTICADQDFPVSKTETLRFEAHDRHCPSPVKELITTSRYVLIKIVLCQRRKLDDSKDMIGIAYSMIRKTWSALPFTNERTDHRFTRCADQDFPVSKTETRWCEAPDRHCLSPVKELITALRFVLIKILPCQRRKLDDLKHMIGIAFHQWKNWSPLYDMCWSRLSFLNRRKPDDLKHMIGVAFHQRKNWSPLYDMCWTRFSFLNRRKLDDLKHIIGIAFHQWKNWSQLYDMCWSRFPFLKDGNSMIWSTWSALPFTIERTDHHFTICAEQVFLPQRRKLDDLKHMIGIAFHQCNKLLTTFLFVLIKIFLSQRRKLDDSKHMIGVAFHQRKNWSPLYDMCWTRFSFLKDGNLMIWSTWSELPFTSDRTDHRFKICAGQNFPLSKTETRRFGRHDRHCLSPKKELNTTLRYVLIKIVLPQKTETQWFEAHHRHCLSPMKELITLYDMCWSRLSFLNRRKPDDLKHMIGVAFHQRKNWSPLYDMCWTRFSCLKDGNSMMWSTWSALPFTSERTDHRFTVCADQDVPVSKTEPCWHEAHDRHCLSPVKDLITTLRYVLIKIFLSQKRNLNELKHMIGIAFHQWKNWSPLYDMCWSRLSFLERRKLNDLKHMIDIAFHQR